jgi:lipopolysaccharide biosynthesis glycosyltransferase
MFKIFIGFDPRETVAYHVAAHSILSRARVPISITPLKRECLPLSFRKRGEHDSTEFAISRFLVPHLCDFEGIALFMDCDVLVQHDISELLTTGMCNKILGDYSVQVVQHDYTPSTTMKFLNQKQTKYARKNWSSVMLFNNELCKGLTEGYVNEAPGLDLHQFTWTDKIGKLDPEWNVLVGEHNQVSVPPKLLHYTLGTPCFAECSEGRYADLWHNEYRDMLRYG